MGPSKYAGLAIKFAVVEIRLLVDTRDEFVSDSVLFFSSPLQQQQHLAKDILEICS